MNTPQDIVAIIGGMGPLASAEFVNTVYEQTTTDREQEMPRLLLWSDPAFPDRTSALLDGRDDLLVRPLQQAIEQCRAMGAERIILCCVTLHAVLPLLPTALASRVVSLVEVLLSATIERQRPQLLLSTRGTRRVGLMERHPLWPAASRWLRWPDDEDQERVHHAIYAIKRRDRLADAVALIESLLHKYEVGSFAAGCTELHLVHKYWRRHASVACLDPLEIVAARIAAPAAASLVRGGGSHGAGSHLTGSHVTGTHVTGTRATGTHATGTR